MQSLHLLSALCCALISFAIMFERSATARNTIAHNTNQDTFVDTDTGTVIVEGRKSEVFINFICGNAAIAASQAMDVYWDWFYLQERSRCCFSSDGCVLWLWDFYEFLWIWEQTEVHYYLFFAAIYFLCDNCSLFILMLLVIDSVLIDLCCLLSLFTLFIFSSASL